ncbi:hypothetical protein AAFF_G00093650 [Aldrovandia affinis]|uniref:Uncharacterized protein n=1 Tax=Aldrovandia affinis TaxID=143900 RepID=A0AAD7WYZ4_9TELE|nr:hypothetical protein AAFF_G00093650 [Aldrovandia affinis]
MQLLLGSDRILWSRLGEPRAGPPPGEREAPGLRARKRSSSPPLWDLRLAHRPGGTKEETTKTKALFIPGDPNSSAFRGKDKDRAVRRAGVEAVAAPEQESAHLHAQTRRPTPPPHSQSHTSTEVRLV